MDLSPGGSTPPERRFAGRMVFFTVPSLARGFSTTSKRRNRHGGRQRAQGRKQLEAQPVLGYRVQQRNRVQRWRNFHSPRYVIWSARRTHHVRAAQRVSGIDPNRDSFGRTTFGHRAARGDTEPSSPSGADLARSSGIRGAFARKRPQRHARYGHER